MSSKKFQKKSSSKNFRGKSLGSSLFRLYLRPVTDKVTLST